MTNTPPQRLRPDAVERQLKAIARQGAHSANLSHLAAMALIVLFSLGSLVSLSGDALASILRQWHTTGGVDVVAAIGVGVSTLVVVCMDMAMLRAASVLRMLAARRATSAEQRGHHAMLYAVAVVEASTYAYMSVLYDAPHSLAAWAIILARAGMAPVVAVYLSMARPLPVERRDILAQAALASGAGVLRDVVTVANDASAPLARKVALYKAADADTQGDAQLDRMIAAMADHATPPTPADMPASASTMAATAREAGDGTSLPDNAYVSAAGSYAVVQHAPDGDGPDPLTTPPTGPGSPVTAPTARTRRQRTPSQPAASLRLVPDRDGLRQQRQQRQAAQGNTQGKVARVQGVRTPNESLEPTARAAFLQGATSIAKMERHTGMSHTAARHWIGVLKAERDATSSAHTSQRIMPAPTLPLPGDSFRGVLSEDDGDDPTGYAL
ncbi:MAG TPA: hypothetical protein VMV29_20895 [Ktedonobacterales bacterium]|nr:hypothetical protein [Ktedonobacterales bacterium]